MSFPKEFTVTVTCDNAGRKLLLTVKASERTVIGKKPITYLVPGGNTRVLSMAEEDAKGWFGIIGSTIVTDWQLMKPMEMQQQFLSWIEFPGF